MIYISGPISTPASLNQLEEVHPLVLVLQALDCAIGIFFGRIVCWEG